MHISLRKDLILRRLAGKSIPSIHAPIYLIGWSINDGPLLTPEVPLECLTHHHLALAPVAKSKPPFSGTQTLSKSHKLDKCREKGSDALKLPLGYAAKNAGPRVGRQLGKF